MRRLCLLPCLPLLFGASTFPACTTTFPNLGPEKAATADALVTAVLDGGVLRLADGRTLLLAPLAVPRERWRGRESIAPIRKLAIRARDRLARLAEGRKLHLAHLESPDRYGRLRAQAGLIGKDGRFVWLQGEMVRAGLARVETEADMRACAAPLLALEAGARREGRGLWRLDLFAVRDTDEVRERTGSFQIVEGRVRTVEERRGRIYLNFGEDWRTDFTVSLSPRAVRLFPEGFWQGRAGRRVRVRGWVERYHGPLIEATHPEQIEWLGNGPNTVITAE